MKGEMTGGGASHPLARKPHMALRHGLPCYGRENVTVSRPRFAV